MKALLEEWSHLEPERCRVKNSLFEDFEDKSPTFYIEVAYFCKDCNELDWWLVLTNEENPDEQDEAMLLFGIIEAVNSHKWSWYIDSNNQQETTYHDAFVRRFSGGSFPRKHCAFKNGIDFFDEPQRGGTPAEALLKAYLQALKQEKEEEA